MALTAGEKIAVILKRKNKTVSKLAEEIGISRQNLTNKLNRDNFTEKELLKIAEALECDLNIEFTSKDTGEKL